MTRQLRIEYPGAYYHVMARGNGRQEIFLDDEDRQKFLSLVSRAHSRHAFELHAYALMPNHYHLLLHTPRGELSRGMRDLNASYSQCFNFRWERVGHLFQGRFKALVIDTNAYLLVLNRYIHQNPVKAGLARHAWEFPWSSCPAFFGRAQAPAWLNLSDTRGRFKDLQEYREFLEEKMEEDPYENSLGQTVLGSPDFLETMRVKARQAMENRSGIGFRQALSGPPSLESIEAAANALFEIQKNGSAMKGRPISKSAVAAFLMRELGGVSVVEIAGRLAMTPSAATNAISRFRRQLTADQKFRLRAGLRELGLHIRDK